MLDGRALQVNRPFKTATASYSQLWETALSDDEKTAIGITWVDDPAPFDSRFYTSPGVPYPLDTTTTDDGTVYGIRPGILQDQKNTAANMLAETDWYVTRKSETDTAIPADVTTYRAAVRTACAAREAEIAAVDTTAALETLMKTAPGESGALTQWPAPLS